MILHRLSVEQLAGIGRAELQLSPRGVHLIEGPNEAGKSTLMTALRLVLFEQDSTVKQSVRALQPAGRDVGSVIEVDMESGDTRFVYRKRFFKKPATELHVLSPEPRHLIGREAHEHVLELLARTVDLDLWRALWIDQGKALEHLAAEQLPALLRSLGGEADTADAVTRGVETEYLRYFTEKRGQPTRLLVEAREAVETTNETLNELKTRHDDLETAVLRRDTVAEDLVALHSRLRTAREQAQTAAESLTEVRRVHAAVEEAQRQCESARLELSLAQREQQERLHLRKTHDDAAAEHETREQEQPALLRAAQAAQEAWAQAQAACTRARDEAAALHNLTPQAGALPDETAVRELLRRLTVESPPPLAAALEQLRTLAVTGEALNRLERLHTAAERTRAAVEAQSARVTVDNLSADEVTLKVDERDHPLAPQESREHAVDRELEVTLPGRLRVRVQAPGQADERVRERDEARTALAQACRELAVTDVEQARWVEQQRRELSAAATTAAQTAAAAAEAAERAAHARHEAARWALADGERRQEEARERAQSAEAALAAAEEATDDNKLATNLKIAQKKLMDLEQRMYDTQDELDDTRLSEAEAAARRADDLVKSLEKKIHDLSLEESGLKAHLAVRGEEGLFEQLQHTAIRGAKARYALDRLERRAAAARRLRSVVQEARQTAHARYADPLRRAIETLGRQVFGADFSVILGPELQIQKRTLEGVTLSVDALSVGAQEQLAVITRLAAAELVARREPVPVFLDDVFGHSDPQRLRALAGLLAQAGERGQVLLLTSYPDRYRDVRDLLRLSVLNPVTA